MAGNSGQRLKVGIVGGSIAGCTAAIEWQRIGCDVTLWERTGDELKDRGAGIGVPISIIDKFIARDLIDANTPYFIGDAVAYLWRTEAAQQYGYLAWEQRATSVLALLNWGGLYKNLRQRVPDSVYKFNHRVVALYDSGSSVRVELADGASDNFDLVVCADGYMSLGRQTLFPDVGLKYAGYVLWRGLLAEGGMPRAETLEHGIACIGYPDGHSLFYFVPGANGSIKRGERLFNWGMYLPVADEALADFLTDRAGHRREGLPPGAMPLATERALKDKAKERLPDYYLEIAERARDTSVYAIYDCTVPAYRKGRICLAGDAGAYARPHSASGAFKGMSDAIALADSIKRGTSLEEAFESWNQARTDENRRLVEFGNQVGRARVKEIPDWSKMNPASMEKWFNSIVTIQREVSSADKSK
jgi:2-polyprenyl-6-methoxyphenol hydroxylase-like FAD-dependent oxidoreductase